jgi:hypothetical protein
VPWSPFPGTFRTPGREQRGHGRPLRRPLPGPSKPSATSPAPTGATLRSPCASPPGSSSAPSPGFSKAFPDEAMRQAVDDLLAHPHYHAAALGEAAAEATAAAGACGLALVALDGVSRTLRDPNDLRGTGSVGRRSKGARGLLAMDAVVLTPGGAMLVAGLVC